MKMQGKADRMMLSEQHNKTAEMQVVMGAASGRVSGGGSLEAIYDKSTSDYMWDHMWNANTETIGLAALSQDQVNIVQAGSSTLMLGSQQLAVDRLASEAGYANVHSQIQNQIENVRTSADIASNNAAGSALMSGVSSIGATLGRTTLLGNS